MIQLLSKESIMKAWLEGFNLYVRVAGMDLAIMSTEVLISYLYLDDYEYIYYQV